MYNDYIIFDVKNIPAAAAEDPKQNTKDNNMNISKDDFLDSIFHWQEIEHWKEIEENERQTNPGAFLLTKAESQILETAFVCFIKVYTSHDKDIDNSKGLESQNDIMKIVSNETIKEINKKRINKKIRAIIDRYNSLLFWSATPEIIKETDNNGFVITSTTYKYLITVKTDNGLNNISLDNTHPFFAAQTMNEKIKTLGYNDLYLYVTKFELDTLENLRSIFILYDSEINGKITTPTAAIDASKFHSIVSSPIMNALSDIGANAKKPQIIKKKNEKGQQITITEILTKSGGKLTLTDFNPHAAGGFISVGDPNTDKLLLQAQIIAMQTGKQSFEISIDEFMKFRKLSDKKAALERAEQACIILRRAGYDIDISDDSTSITGGWNYMQKCIVKRQRGRAGNVIIIELTNDVFNHVIELSRKGQQIEQFDKKITTIPDNQNTAYNIARKLEHHVRFNAGKRNSHIIGVNTLIDCCPLLPLYPELITDAGKENYLRYPSEAPQRIIKPFIKGLDFITKDKQNNEDYQIIENYTFRHKKGGVLTDSEISQAIKDYKLFTNLNIEFVLCNEPNYQKVIESKAKHEEKTPGKAKQQTPAKDPKKRKSKS